MAFRPSKQTVTVSALALVASFAAYRNASPQVFVVGEKTAMADVSTDFHPTRVELPSTPINERDRRALVRDLEAEQGFAHRNLPLACDITLLANGNMTPGGDEYKQLLYKKGQSAAAGDRVAITTVTVKPDRILLDINGGPYLKHRFLRHVELNDTPVVQDNGEQVTGFRVTLIFEGGIPDISAPEVKALLDPIIDFGIKTGAQAYADTLPPFLKQAIDRHDVLVGMNRRMVLAAMGAPDSKVRELLDGSSDKHYEEWIYGRVPQTVHFVRIVNDRVVQVRTAALGQPIATRTENELQGYLDPVDTHEIAMGDSAPSGDEDARPAGRPPTILKPGEGAATAQRVQYPVGGSGSAKVQPLPPEPGSPADPNAVGNSLPPAAGISNAPAPGGPGGR